MLRWYLNAHEDGLTVSHCKGKTIAEVRASSRDEAWDKLKEAGIIFQKDSDKMIDWCWAKGWNLTEIARMAFWNHKIITVR